MKLKINLILIRIFIISLILIEVSFAASKIEEIFKEKSEIENPMSLRDPFLSPKIRGKKKSRVANKVGKGVYSNVPILGVVKIDQIRIIGVVIGANRRAFVKLSRGNAGEELSKETFVIKEGMKLGENKAELKAILPGGIVLVEKNTNIYGEDEYLETVIPISK